MDKKQIANIVIGRLGGTSKAARFFEVEPPSVCDWRQNGIPKARMMYLRVAHPEFFDDTGNLIVRGSTEKKHSASEKRRT